MSNKNLKIELKAKKDRDNRVFYVGKIQGPFLIDLSEGAAFLIYVSDKGYEELQIANLSKKEDREDYKEYDNGPGYSEQE